MKVKMVDLLTKINFLEESNTFGYFANTRRINDEIDLSEIVEIDQMKVKEIIQNFNPGGDKDKDDCILAEKIADANPLRIKEGK